jgi:hypothetical protein
MCGGKIADVAANVIWKILIGGAQVKVKSWHVRGSLLSVIKIAHRMSQVQIDFVLNVIDAGRSAICRRCAGPLPVGSVWSRLMADGD